MSNVENNPNATNHSDIDNIKIPELSDFMGTTKVPTIGRQFRGLPLFNAKVNDDYLKALNEYRYYLEVARYKLQEYEGRLSDRRKLLDIREENTKEKEKKLAEMVEMFSRLFDAFKEKSEKETKGVSDATKIRDKLMMRELENIQSELSKINERLEQARGFNNNTTAYRENKEQLERDLLLCRGRLLGLVYAYASTVPSEDVSLINIGSWGVKDFIHDCADRISIAIPQEAECMKFSNYVIDEETANAIYDGFSIIGQPLDIETDMYGKFSDKNNKVQFGQRIFFDVLNNVSLAHAISYRVPAETGKEEPETTTDGIPRWLGNNGEKLPKVEQKIADVERGIVDTRLRNE